MPQTSTQTIPTIQIKRWAHDIKSPLACLRILTRTDDGFSPETRELLHGAIDRIQSMTQEILSGPIDAPIEPLSTLIDNVVAMKWLEISDRPGVTLEAKFGRGTQGIGAAMPSLQFVRLLSNLINNAVEAVGHSGRVCVSLSSTASDAMITIEDNGCGMSEEVVKKVILQGVSHNKPRGTGLGVSHALEAVKNAGGKLTIDSIPNIGTAVKIWLPLSAT